MATKEQEEMGQRCWFINRTGTPVPINVFTHDRIQLVVLVSSPVGLQGNALGPLKSGTFTLEIPPGTTCGFVTEHTAAVKNPIVKDFDIRIANGNVPWPEPPPENA